MSCILRLPVPFYKEESENDRQGKNEKRHAVLLRR